jgi:hypothetical protein
LLNFVLMKFGTRPADITSALAANSVSVDNLVVFQFSLGWALGPEACSRLAIA